ncbi:unnamed protein product [Bursaphelenchus xylophilus]|uniref:(pine wood nematode) hypothetical protein n=1 Tax=Bursaphelenchus xylophilus TaxID=6326 RepID=A0A1I7SD41_BURXY|nr:unnamed protein product [Bursaphelenchus xylophilus]CAG9092976.1 unnamed protein product [Bursaphelenchus xylophilus]
MYRQIQQLQKRVTAIEQELRLEDLANENTRIRRQLSELEDQERLVFLETLRQSEEISSLEDELAKVYARLRVSNVKLFQAMKDQGKFGEQRKQEQPPKRKRRQSI